MSRRLHLVTAAVDIQSPAGAAAAAAAEQRRFAVRITRPDGSIDHTVAIGGDSVGHAVDAINRAGVGARISVRALPAHVAGEAA